MATKDLQVQVRVPCETCGGTGQGDVIPQRTPQLGGPTHFACTGCNGRGATSTEWVSLRELAGLIAGELPSVVRNATGITF